MCAGLVAWGAPQSRFFSNAECCIMRGKRIGEIWAFYRESYEKGKYQPEKGKKKFGRFEKKSD